MIKSRVAAIVSTRWLKSQLTPGTSKLKLLDATWNLQHTGPEEYFTKHIPGALFLDQNRCVKPKPTCARNIPEPKCFQDYLRSLGVNMDSHLVVYDRGGLVPAARAWWTLRYMGHPAVSVLNGGLKQWEEDGEATEMGDGEYSGPAGDFEVQAQKDIIKHFKDMEQIAKTGSSQILDSRSPDNFLGLEPEPSESTVNALESCNLPLPKKMNKGHIRNAIHFPIGPLKDEETGLLKSKEELRKVFENAGVKLDLPITTLCYNGNNACFLALSAAVAGKDDAAVYYGSWTEFGQLADPSLCVVRADSRKHG